MRKIDIFTHIYPRAFYDKLMRGRRRLQGRRETQPRRADALRPRRAVSGDGPVPGLPAGPVAADAAARSHGRRRPQAVDLARLANDGMAELVAPLPGSLRGVRRLAAVQRSRRGGARSAARGGRSRRARHPDLLQRAGQADFRAGVSADLRDDGRLRSADLAAPVPRSGLERLSNRGRVGVRNLVDVRLAVRHQRRDGAARLRRSVRSLSRSQDHQPSHGRDGAVLRRPGRSRLGSARRAHVRPGSVAGVEAA